MMNYDVVNKRAKSSHDISEKSGSLWLDRGELDKMAFQVAGSIEFCSEQEADIPARPPGSVRGVTMFSSHPFDSLVKPVSFWITAGIAAGSGSMAMSRT
jgi:hypothetical protein